MSSKVGVLLLHGLTGVPSEMRPVEKYLQKMGFQTEAPLLAGHGGTHGELMHVSWKEWIEGAQQSLDRLLERVDSVVLCGLSMGASLCTILASRNEKVSGLILLSPTLAYDSPELDRKKHLSIFKSQLLRDCLHVLVTIFPIIGRTIYWTETPPYGLKDERLQRQITKSIEAAKRGEETKFGLFRTYWISLYQFNYISDEFRRTAAFVGCPTLMVSSLEDTLVSIHNATKSYQMLGSKARSLAMISGCDHVLTLDLKRNYLCRLIGEFMEAITQIPAAATADDPPELTAEIYNNLNPLGADWSRLVPGSPSFHAWGEWLQSLGAHESQCHTLVMRRKNVPAMMLPFMIDEQKKTAYLAIEQPVWGTPAAPALKELASDGMLEQVWQQSERILQSLFRSYGVRSTKYAEPGSLKRSEPPVSREQKLPHTAQAVPSSVTPQR